MAWLKWMRTKNRTAKSCWSSVTCWRNPNNCSMGSGKYIVPASIASAHTAHCQSVTRFKFLQGSAAVRPSSMAGVLWPHVRRVHQAVEVPAATSSGAGLQIRPEALANRRDRQQDRTVVLSLLVSCRLERTEMAIFDISVSNRCSPLTVHSFCVQSADQRD